MSEFAQTALAVGDTEAAAQYFRSARSVLESVGDRRAAAQSTANLGLVHRASGQEEQAMEELERALREFRDVGADEEACTIADWIGIQGA
jgi:Tfp pilus assembly protein PilF